MHHLVGNNEEAEDSPRKSSCVSTVAARSNHPKAKFSTWLYTIANNLALNVLRTRQRRPTIPLNVRDSGPLGPRPPSNWCSIAAISRRIACRSRN